MGPRGGGRGSQYRLRIDDLDNHTSWQDLKDFGRKAGVPTRADVFPYNDKRGGKWG